MLHFPEHCLGRGGYRNVTRENPARKLHIDCNTMIRDMDFLSGEEVRGPSFSSANLGQIAWELNLELE
jgi:hypothetical protein